MALNLLAGFQHVQEQGDQGRMRYADKLLGQAYTAAPDARQSALAKLAGVDGAMAMQAENAFTQRDRSTADFAHTQEQRKREELLNGAKLYLGAPEPMRPHVLSTIAPTLTKYGIDPSSATPEQIAQAAQAIVSAWGTGPDGVPAGYREFDLLTQAAGTTPEDRARAARVRLGLEGRASNAGYGFDMVEDAYGNPRPQRRNPRDGSVEVFHAESQQWVPLGGAGPMPAGGSSLAPGGGIPPAGDIFAGLKAAVPGLRITDQFRTPEENAALPNAVPNSYHLKGQAIDIGAPTPEQQRQIAAWLQTPEGSNFELIRNYSDGHWHLEPRPGRAPAAQPTGLTIAPPVTGSGAPAPSREVSPVLGLGRSKEAEAAAVERARIGVGLDTAPAVADAAADAARKRKEAELAAERNAAIDKRTAQASETVTMIQDALAILPKATGGMLEQGRDAAARSVNQSTEGSRATARLKLLAAKLTANVPRFEGPQSVIDVQFYREAAGDLANPDLSVGERVAAAELMLEIAQRYAGQDGADPAPAAPVGADGWGMTRVK